ncbi:MAG: hypothetical protein RLZZ597_2254 [Cyanobacteriota bacterium]|jgi:hypothetical protein
MIPSFFVGFMSTFLQVEPGLVTRVIGIGT